MVFKNIILEKKAGVARITLNRPEALNALNPQVLAELKRALEDAQRDGEVRVVVLRGAGRAFCAGLDIKFASELLDAGQDEGLQSFIHLGHQIIELMEGMEKPIVAAVHGYAITGGFVLAYFSDIVIASEDAVFQDTHARWGLVPGWWEAQRLPRVLGLFRGKGLLFTSDRVSAQEAYQMGLVYKVVPREGLDGAVEELAGKLLKQSPAALGLIKAQVNRGMKLDWPDALKVDEWTRKGLFAGFVTEDGRERLRAFTEKREP